MFAKTLSGATERVKFKKETRLITIRRYDSSHMRRIKYIVVDSQERKHIVLMMDNCPEVSRTSVLIPSKYASRSNGSHYKLGGSI